MDVKQQLQLCFTHEQPNMEMALISEVLSWLPSVECRSCGAIGSDRHAVCADCMGILCDGCGVFCPRCDEMFCHGCLRQTKCGRCSTELCGNCSFDCFNAVGGCGVTLCIFCIKRCFVCGSLSCKDDCVQQCKSCRCVACAAQCLRTCDDCGTQCCSRCFGNHMCIGFTPRTLHEYMTETNVSD